MCSISKEYSRVVDAVKHFPLISIIQKEGGGEFNDHLKVILMAKLDSSAILFLIKFAFMIIHSYFVTSC